ncbi:MAG TPA: permease-like cell division protein FtsX, partial [Bacteroidales bacterium]|nr:permease-like cell division protein FtsX [Bacteroidales bacterium]
FLLGIVGFLILNARNIRNYVKENIGFNIELKDNLREADMQQLKKMLDAKTYVRSSDYISKEEAAEETRKALGEDFIAFLGYNPLPAVIKVRLKAPYANPDSILYIEKELKTYPQVNDIFYRKTLLHEIDANVRKISLVIVSFSFLLLLIALTLINNTIRLNIYSKRFIIHTMKLVGATKRFIRRPFVWKGIYHGFIASLIAIGLLTGLMFIAQKQVKDILYILDPDIIGLLFLAVMITGILISMVSTFFAVTRYLNLKKDDLYY